MFYSLQSNIMSVFHIKFSFSVITFLALSFSATCFSQTIIDTDFDSNTGGFSYLDDAFRNTTQPAYATGKRVDTGGFRGGVLQVIVGGIDNADILNMSGAWQQNFFLDEPTDITVSLQYNLTQASDYESDELSQALLTIDGALVSTGSSDFITQIVGNGNGGTTQTTGWQAFEVNIGSLPPGQHSIAFGGFNNKKTYNNESTTVLIDDIRVSGQPSADDVIVQADFDSGSDGFVYIDDPFRNTVEPRYAEGSHINTGGFSGGGLEVTLGGIDNADIFGMSGGWQQSFSSIQGENISLSFRFNLTQQSDYENDEFAQALVSVDGVLQGQPLSDFVVEVTGNGNGGNSISTGWQTFQVNLGSLNAGAHELIIGGYSNKKTYNNESTQILIDDVLISRTSGDDSAEGAIAAVASLDLQRFKDNIKTLASFGDRTQGSQSYASAAAWVETQLQAAGYSVEHHAYTFQGESRESLYATKIGTRFPDRMYIISAHLDGRGGGGAADDDGSGSSLVLEAARVLAQPEFETDVSVRFIFWNNEETGLNGSSAYVNDRVSLQGIESPTGSGQFPEPMWLGIIQHDMILFDHGLPPQATQIADADIDIEYQASSTFASQSSELANALNVGNGTHSTDYPSEIGANMSNTDSVSFRDFTAAVSVRENQRSAEIGNGSNPHWHQPTDVFSTYSELDFKLGFNALQMTLGTVAKISGVRIRR